MSILYSKMLPLISADDSNIFITCFKEQLSNSDRLDIAVGYVSEASLNELNQLIENYNLKEVNLNIGMYFIEGIPENIYHNALRMNKIWKQKEHGEIRLIQPFKYHGKVYCFYKNDVPISAIIGSANLGALKLEASNRRQFELSILVTSPKEVNEIAKHINELKSSECSSNIADVDNLILIKNANTALNNIELVKNISGKEVNFYKNCVPKTEFNLKLKVPGYKERFLDDNRHYTKSNINVCYAAPRSKRKARDWYETQITVGSEIYKMDGYPEKNKPFFIVTDDGYMFKAHTTSDNNKQFSAVGDELIMGRWLKGRLAAAGIVRPINNVAEDVNRDGMITQEMLEEYGCDTVVFKDTGKTAIDDNGQELNVWMLSFIGNNIV